MRDRLLGRSWQGRRRRGLRAAGTAAEGRCSRRSGPSTPSARASRSTRSRDVDVSLPRRESKIGRGHRASRSTGDPDMPPEEAARRRDFTVNAIAWDPLTRQLPRSVRWPRAICSSAGCCAPSIARTFGDDSLRVLRGIQFAARFELEMDAGTKALCRTHPARRSAGRARLGRDREAAAPRRAAVDRLRARARARRDRSAVPRAEGARRLPAGTGVAPRRRRLGAHAARHRSGAHAHRRPRPAAADRR